MGQRGSCPTRGLASAPPRYPPRQVRPKARRSWWILHQQQLCPKNVNRNDWHNIFVCLFSVEWMSPTHASSNVVQCTKSHMCASHFKAKCNCHKKLAFCHKVGYNSQMAAKWYANSATRNVLPWQILVCAFKCLSILNNVFNTKCCASAGLLLKAVLFSFSG